MMPRLLISLILITLCGCAKRAPVDHAAMIRDSLGGHAIVTQVSPPTGPFDLIKPGSIYYRATVPQTGRVFYVEAYVSSWTVLTAAAGSNEAVYRYAFYRELPFHHYWRVSR